MPKIWFQNRRQNDRRKSRPLSPQEVAALRYGGMQILSSDPPMPYSFSSDNIETSPNQGSAWPDRSATSPMHTGPARPGTAADEPGKAEDASKEDEPRPDVAKEDVPPTDTQPQRGEILEPSSSQQLSQSFSSVVGYLSNRWNPGSSFSTPPSALGDRGDESLRYGIGHAPYPVCSRLIFSPGSSPSSPLAPPPPSSLSPTPSPLSLLSSACRSRLKARRRWSPPSHLRLASLLRALLRAVSSLSATSQGRISSVATAPLLPSRCLLSRLLPARCLQQPLARSRRVSLADDRVMSTPGSSAATQTRKIRSPRRLNTRAADPPPLPLAC